MVICLFQTINHMCRSTHIEIVKEDQLVTFILIFSNFKTFTVVFLTYGIKFKKFLVFNKIKQVNSLEKLIHDINKTTLSLWI